MIPRNINPNRALQIAINGRDQLLQIPSGCFNLTDYGVECIADDMSVFAPWESIQWLEQSDDIDAVFNSYANNNDGNNDDYNTQTSNPFNDNNINKTLLKKCLRYNIIIKDDRSGYFRVKFSNQILGRTINEVLGKIDHNLKLKAFLIQESETMDNDNIMNAYTTDTEDDDAITDDTPVIRRTRDNHNDDNNDYKREPAHSKPDDIQSQNASEKSSYVTEDRLRQMIGDDKYDELMSRINKTSSDESNNTDSMNNNANNNSTVNNTDNDKENEEDDDIIIDDGFEDYDDNDNNLVMNEPENKESESTDNSSSASHDNPNVNTNNNANVHMMIPNLEDQSRNTIKPSRRKIKNNNKKTSDSDDNDASKTENTIPTLGFGMKTENANNNATVNNNESEPEHLTAYKIDDNTPGNDDTKDENGYDYVILFTCDGFIGSIESRWKDYESALNKCNELNSSPNVKQSLVHIHYSVYKAKGTQLVNRKYQVLTADGLPDSSYNEYGEKIQS